MSDKIGLFTGSFDPMTTGHLDIIEFFIIQTKMDFYR